MGPGWDKKVEIFDGSGYLPTTDPSKISTFFAHPGPSKISTFFAHPGPIKNYNFSGPPRTHPKFQLFLHTYFCPTFFARVGKKS